jgi:beta-glucosidase
MRIPGKGQPYPPPTAMPFVKPDDMTANLSQPSALGNGVEYLYDEIKKPIFVTENGLETEDDKRRIWYVDQVLSGLHASIAKGVPVIGYCHWSLLDNFEWLQGYKPKFGLIAVDRSSFKRTVKPSGLHLGAIAKKNSI